MAVCREGKQQRDREEDIARCKGGRTGGTLNEEGCKKGRTQGQKEKVREEGEVEVWQERWVSVKGETKKER